MLTPHFTTLGTIMVFALHIALSVRSCFFCADSIEKCKENVENDYPHEQDCQTMEVSGDNPLKFIVQPSTLLVAKSSNHLFSSPLKKRSVKTQCISITFTSDDKAKDKALSLSLKPDKDKDLIFQSCAYQNYEGYSNSCGYFLQYVIPEEVFTNIHCNLCKREHCNFADQSTFNFWWLILMCLGVVLV